MMSLKVYSGSEIHYFSDIIAVHVIKEFNAKIDEPFFGVGDVKYSPASWRTIDPGFQTEMKALYIERENNHGEMVDSIWLVPSLQCYLMNSSGKTIDRI